MPRSAKYVILDIDHLANHEVNAVYEPFSERAAAEWLRKKCTKLGGIRGFEYVTCPNYR